MKYINIKGGSIILTSNMKKFVLVYKKSGITPYEAIQVFRNKFREYKNVKISHAGKLDPLAEGLMILVFGDEIRNLKKYLRLDKEYYAKICFGISTDSHDSLGIASSVLKCDFDIEDLKNLIESLKGDYFQTIPKFSSKKIKGRSLVYYARKGIETDDVTSKVEIKKIKVKKNYFLSNHELMNYINKKVKVLKGDFRQDEILDTWKKVLFENNKFLICEVVIRCSSGTYIRSIAHDLGKRSNCNAFLLDLRRDAIGPYRLSDAIII